MSEHARDDTGETYYSFVSEHASNNELLEQLAMALVCASEIPQPDPSQLEAGIAELVCEIVRRGLELPNVVHEPMVPEHALRRVEIGISTGNARMVWDAMPYLGGAAPPVD